LYPPVTKNSLTRTDSGISIGILKKHMKMEIITLSEICESIYRSFSKFEDIKEVMRNHISINRRQWNGQKKKGKR
jgi:uncharacterized membrane protein